MFPEDLSKYEIFRAEVIAPCAGEIIGVESRAPNQAPLHPDYSGFGNYIALYCPGHTVRLVHLDGASVKVAVGESVTTGQLLGTSAIPETPSNLTFTSTPLPVVTFSAIATIAAWNRFRWR